MAREGREDSFVYNYNDYPPTPDCKAKYSVTVKFGMQMRYASIVVVRLIELSSL